MKDLTGQTFGLLTVTQHEYRVGGTGRKHGGYVCECKCGVTTWARTEDLTHHKKTSCSHTCPEKLGRSLSAYLQNTKPNGECMEWQGAVTKSGYGRVGGHPNHKYVHREVFNMVNGVTPEVVMHLCDNPLCINPEHLSAGSHKDNFMDMFSKQRNARGEQVHTAKLTMLDVINIRKQYDNGVKVSVLAKQYKTAHSTMSAVCKRITWSHV